MRGANRLRTPSQRGARPVITDESPGRWRRRRNEHGRPIDDAGFPLNGYGRLLAALAIAAFLALWFVVALPAAGDRTPFYTKGEPREALVVQTIVRGEGLLLPMRNGDELPSKPPMFHWLAALASLVEGRVTEGPIRLPGLLFALLTVAATAAASWAWWGASTALLATVILGTSFQWVASSVAARVDMVLAATVALALLLFERAMETGRRIPAAAFALLTVATLTKGPVGLVLPVAIALGTLALRREFAFVGWRELRLLAIASAVAGLWYVAALVIGGEAFFAKQVLKENVFRVLDPDSVEAGHVAPFWYYVPLLLAGMAPWSLFAPGLAAAWLSTRSGEQQPATIGPAATVAEPGESAPVATGTAVPARREAADPRILFASIWALVPFVVFSLAGSKRAVYLLPAYPAYAMLVAIAWSRVMRGGNRASTLAALSAGSFLVSAILVVASLAVLAGAIGVPVNAWIAHLVSNADVNNVAPMVEATREHRAVVVPCCLAMLACAWATVVAARRGRWARVVAAVSIAMLALSATVSTTLLPALASRRSARSFLAQVAERVPLDVPLSFYRAFDYGAVFYRGAPIPVRKALTDVPEIDGAWLLTWPAFLPDLAGEARKLDTGSAAAGAYEVEEVLTSEDVDPSDKSTLVLVRIARRIGDEHPGGN
jgi:4-amino-4-deoxy-L-arabinose transferase-like glycosyltransferase